MTKLNACNVLLHALLTPSKMTTKPVVRYPNLNARMSIIQVYRGSTVSVAPRRPHLKAFVKQGVAHGRQRRRYYSLMGGERAKAVIQPAQQFMT